MRIRRTFSNEPGQRMESHLRATPFYRPLKASAASVLGQRFATLGTDSGLPHRIRTLRAEAAPQPKEPPQGERAGDQQPEERGVEERVEGEAEW